MIPLWAISAIGAGVIAGVAGFGGGYFLAKTIGDKALSDAKAGWADERTEAARTARKALQAEIEAHNATQAILDASNAKARDERIILETKVVTVAAAASAAQRSDRRMRDELATNRLATRAALEAAGALGQCQASLAAIGVRDELLGRYRDKATELGEFGRAVGAAFERQTAAASQCASDYEVTR